MHRPMKEMLTKTSNRKSFHMPGAQGNIPFENYSPYCYDTTEIPFTDNLFQPNHAIVEAEKLIQESAKTNGTILLPFGATAGIHAMILYACKHGQSIILPRNVHTSALNICAIAGIEPIFAEPSYTSDGLIYTSASAYEQALRKNPNAKAVLAIHNDYYGVLGDISTIAKCVHSHGKLLLCDEAHGAYFNWRTDVKNAGELGADIFVQSAHKTLPALTPGAWLHCMNTINKEELRSIVRMLQTSSPSFIIMLSLDDARAWMDEYGNKKCEQLLSKINDFYKKIEKYGYSDARKDDELEYDNLRLVINSKFSSEFLAKELENREIDIEMYENNNIICILSLIDGAIRLDKLFTALVEIANKNSCKINEKISLNNIFYWPERKMPLQQAVFSDYKLVAIENAIGELCATNIGLYPPGVAWITPGDKIDIDIIKLIKNIPNKQIFGLTDNRMIKCIK